MSCRVLTLSCCILPCLALSCLVWSCLVLSGLAVLSVFSVCLSCPVLSVLSCLVVSCPVLSNLMVVASPCRFFFLFFCFLGWSKIWTSFFKRFAYFARVARGVPGTGVPVGYTCPRCLFLRFVLRFVLRFGFQHLEHIGMRMLS